MSKGMVHVYTGDGKGKTTAALGLALRAWGAGRRVKIIYFDKGGDFYSERTALDRLGPGLTYRAFGLERADLSVGGRFRFGNSQADRAAAREALECAHREATNGEYDLLVLDELVTSIGSNLVSLEQALAIIQAKRPDLELVLTGRRCPPALAERADLVSEIREAKHYFKAGVPARKGIDF